MTTWFAILLGVVQGATEFLPISSTAHLRIAPAILGLADPGAAFTAVIQLGTLAAVILYFRRDLVAMFRAVVSDRRSRHGRLALFIVAGTVPIGVAGIALKHVVTGEARSLHVVATALILVAVVMWIADRGGRQERGLDSLRLADALLIGVAQACALVPGVSRSGSTLAAALFLGLRRDDAARFSFLLSIPAIGAAGVFELPFAVRELSAQGGSLMPLLLATIVSGVAGYVSIAWLLRFLRTRSLGVFVVYRVLLGMILFGLVLGGVVSASD
ncbi:MAG: undecaprenyl-diphosphatase UppP [Deltaproteobacteria bacterium]|nr:undecaprenyl-diphosphatase UppP [Deltaproteobacteria bacterium]